MKVEVYYTLSMPNGEEINCIAKCDVSTPHRGYWNAREGVGEPDDPGEVDITEIKAEETGRVYDVTEITAADRARIEEEAMQIATEPYDDHDDAYDDWRDEWDRAHAEKEDV